MDKWWEHVTTAPEHHFYLKRLQENGQWYMNKAVETSKDDAFRREGTVFKCYNNRSQYLLITPKKLSGYTLEGGATSGSTTVGAGTTKSTPVKVSGISKKIAAGKKIQLKANQAVTWKSSNTKVATVSKSGLVTFKKNSGGKSVTITATAKSGKKAVYKITAMKGIVKKVAISGKKSVTAGKSLKLKAKVTASARANKTLQWTSSNKKYAKVSSSGTVKTYKAGKGKTVKITAKATDGSNKKMTVKIKIK